MSRPKPKPRSEEEIANFINKGKEAPTKLVVEVLPAKEDEEGLQIPIKENVESIKGEKNDTEIKNQEESEGEKISKSGERRVVKKSLTLDEEVDRGLRFVVAEEKKNHSKIIEELIRAYLIKSGLDKKHNLKLN